MLDVAGNVIVCSCAAKMENRKRENAKSKRC
jgi:hypothetical protein